MEPNNDGGVVALVFITIILTVWIVCRKLRQAYIRKSIKVGDSVRHADHIEPRFYCTRLINKGDTVVWVRRFDGNRGEFSLYMDDIRVGIAPIKNFINEFEIVREE